MRATTDLADCALASECHASVRDRARNPTSGSISGAIPSWGAICDDSGEPAGIDPVSAHDLGRTFGRIPYHERQCDVNAIRARYGHSSTEMARYYIRVSMDKLQSTGDCIDRPGPPMPARPPLGAPGTMPKRAAL